MIVHRRGPADLLQEVMRMRKWCRIIAVMSCFLILCGCGESGAVYSVADSGVRIGESVSETISGDSSAGSISAKETSGEPKTLFVYVCGEVCRPGVYELPENSRVYQALDAAGGLTGAADRKTINQAELLSDGQQITVYSVEETSAPIFSGTAAGSPSGIQQPGSGNSGKININTAGKEELMTLSGIGESRAEDIIRYREEHGKFSSVEDIQNVSGIGEKSFQKIKDQIEV